MRQHRIAALLTACSIALLAAGCAPFWTETQEALPVSPAAGRPDPAETRLAEAAARAERALTALARIRAAETPPPAAKVPLSVPAALRRPVTLDWIGPLETLAATLARRTGYRFVGAGAAPVRPVMVAIMARNAPLIEVLRDAGIQAGAAATLTVDAEERTVRLDWTEERPVTAPGSGGT